MIFRELTKQADWGDARVLAAARTMASRLDTRIDHRKELVDLAHDGLHDLVLTERIGRTLPVDEAPLMTSQGLLIAAMTKDVTLLKARLADPAVSGESAATIVTTLARLGAMTDAEARAELRRRAALAKDDYNVRSVLARYLLEKKAYADARDAVQPWLADNKDKPGLEPVAATTIIAQAYRLEGKYAEAWKLLEPVLPSQKGATMEEAAWTLDALGRGDEAEGVARRALERYPNAGMVSDLVELLWRHGKSDEATRVLAPPTVPMTVSEVREYVGGAFVRGFAKRSDAEAIQAFRGLSGLGTPPLSEIAVAINASGRHALAFDASSGLSAPGLENLELLLRSYKALKAAKSDAEAVAWLRAHVPPPLLEPLSQFAIGEGADSLVWEVVPTPTPSRHDDIADSIWLFRAVSVSSGSAEAHRDELMKHYQGPAGGRYDVIGRYVTGLAKESDVLALAAKAHDACEIAFWLGRGAQGEGRTSDASDWYRVSLETGLRQVWEYQQAYVQLTRWWDAGVSLQATAPPPPSP